MTAIREAARKSGDRRLAALSALVASSGAHFDKVIAAIDKMVATLKAQMDEDLANKEACEKDRMEDVRTAQVMSREIDEISDTITKLEGEIEEIIAQVEEMMAQVKAIRE